MRNDKETPASRLRDTFNEPPRLKNASDEERKTGFEFEFTGIEMNETADLLQSLYGGEVKEISTYEFEVNNTELGDFKIELDASLFQEKKYEEFLDTIGVDVNKMKDKDKFEERLRSIAATVVPYEIITSPIPFSSFSKLQDLIFEMRKRKVQGTGSSIFHAFGLHLNPEIPDEDPQLLLDYLRAYVILDPWIRKDAETDISRRITPYINEFKKDYVKLILDENYQPDLEKLITDYIENENTRNRPLDMLPIFMYLDEELVTSLSDDERISGRPAFHYRLPNFSIENHSWSIAGEWNRWVLVERMAEDKKALSQYSRKYLQMKEEMLFGVESKWTKLIERWVSNLV